MAKTTLEQSLLELDQLLDGNDPGAVVHERRLPAPPTFTGDEIKALRQSIPATQIVFAQMMAASPRTVQAWETNRSKPNGPARRLMQIFKADPQLAKALV
ncbi:helix-turn-helix domain-containing protein [Levilactobacillus zymae]|uniref:helix-turn-helix domain-containing protein n=1 Tax=Levilactobacillus zymae TaxID=267363 RepID=UPI000B40060B|nr:XRE family transcriptional regulator [Levilactobacillus zymae]